MPNSHVATIDVAEVIHLCVTSVHESYIYSVSLSDQPFSSYKPFWDKGIEWHRNDIEHYKVRGMPYMCY